MSVSLTQSIHGSIMPTYHKQELKLRPHKSHFLSVEVADWYGYVESLLITLFSNRLSWYQERGLNFHKGKTWMRISQLELKKLYPYLKPSAVRRATENLVKLGILETDIFNHTAYDRTTWYTLNLESVNAMLDQIIEESKKEPSICQEPDLPFAKSDKCIDIVYNNTMYKKAAAEKPQTLEPSDAEYRSAAAASLVKKTRPEIKVYACLEALDIAPTEKQHITRRFPQALVEEAVAWATSPGVVIKRSLIAALKWYCNQAPGERPKPREDAQTLFEENKKTAISGERRFTSDYATIDVCKESLMMSSPQGYTLFELRYDNKNFIDELNQEMIKREFRKK